jgi:hypothetical protein
VNQNLTAIYKGAKAYRRKLASVPVAPGIFLPKALIYGETPELKDMALQVSTLSGNCYDINNSMKGLGLEMIHLSEAISELVKDDIPEEEFEVHRNLRREFLVRLSQDMNKIMVDSDSDEEQEFKRKRKGLAFGTEISSCRKRSMMVTDLQPMSVEDDDLFLKPPSSIQSEVTPGDLLSAKKYEEKRLM